MLLLLLIFLDYNKKDNFHFGFIYIAVFAFVWGVIIPIVINLPLLTLLLIPPLLFVYLVVCKTLHKENQN